MQKERISVLVVGANASTKFEGSSKQDTTRGCASETKRSRSWTSFWGPTPTEFLTSKTPKCIRRSAGFNLALRHGWGSDSLYYPQVLATQWRQRSAVPHLVKKLGIDVVHQPTPISPRLSGLLTNFPAPLIIGPMNGAISTSRAFASCNPEVHETARSTPCRKTSRG